MRSLDSGGPLVDGVLDVLARAGSALAQSGGIQDALAAVAKICASTVADYCSIGVVIEGLGGEEFAVTAGIQPKHPIPDACRTVLPLVAGRRRFGAMICSTVNPQGFDELSQRAMELIATQLAVMLALHSAAAREHQIAERFQRALLPPAFPRIDGSEFHAVYRPAGGDADVGGDWYDVFILEDTRVAISIGDVAGHGLDAAVSMGEVRLALRAAAMREGVSPAEALEDVNGLLRVTESAGMVTAIFGIYDTASSVLTYAAAGHPAPLLALPKGLVVQLPTGGLPLGCSDRSDTQNWTFTIPQGSRVVFITDGIIENERDVIAGEQTLISAIRWLGNAPGGNPAEIIARRVFEASDNRDDAAVLSLTREATVAEYVFSAASVVSPVGRAIVGRELAALSISEDRRFGMLVAVGEAIANAVEHAYRGGPPGLIRLAVQRFSRELIVTVEDYGRWRPFVRREERGRGIELMHAFTDGVQIRSTRSSTAIVLRLDLTTADV